MFNVQVKNYFQNPILISGQKGVPTAIAKEKKVFLFYEESNAICLAISKDGINFKKYNKNPILKKRGKKCRNPRIFKTEKGYFLFYKIVEKAKKTYVGGAFSSNLLLWRKTGKITLAKKQETIDKDDQLFVSVKKNLPNGGLVEFQGKWLLYYYSEIDKGISVAFLDFWKVLKEEEPLKLIKFEGNPILEPRKRYFWESKACFNAAAIYEQGKVYIIYRSITEDDVSVLGLAISKDGINVSERLAEPIYVPREPFEINPFGKRTYYIGFSGSGHSGCEDPRIVKIEDRFYMTYVAFDGCNPPRIALTSIKESDFLSYQWDGWEKPILISPPGIGEKQACIFPEKIIGNYVFLHRIFPDIWLDFVPDLKFEDRWLAGNIFAKPRKDKWDSLKIGAAASPLKTEKGWLLIYNGVNKEDYKYKIGAMLLDLKDPFRVLARSNQPILAPDNSREGNITYSCGSVIIEDQLYVYYGQNDYSLGVATANLKEFLQKLG